MWWHRLRDVLRLVSFIFAILLTVALFVLFSVLVFIDEDERTTYIGYLLSLLTLHIPAPVTLIRKAPKTVTPTPIVPV